MKKIIIIVSALIFGISACNHTAEVNKADPLESGRGFIEASLQGNYVEAKKYILDDSTNNQYFEGLKDFNSKLSYEERLGLRDANIIIDSIHQVSDSVSIITYSNTYKNIPSKLKMVRQNKEWLVDFKYTFQGNQ
ncbi:MAG: hypothetical protein Q8891_04940 [Bacteroidota bacterium]|jgi:hypothetical protein|nr:hypothetical protein [Bacteroidota bacterium]